MTPLKRIMIAERTFSVIADNTKEIGMDGQCDVENECLPGTVAPAANSCKYSVI